MFAYLLALAPLLAPMVHAPGRRLGAVLAEVPPVPGHLWTSWQLDPVVPLLLALAAILYGRGLRRIWERPDRARSELRGRAVAFYAGLLVLLITLVSPVDRLAAALLSVHMGQYLLLTIVAPPLLVVGQPGAVMPLALPPERVRRVRRWWARAGSAQRAWEVVSEPVGAAVLDTGMLLFWHIPAIYTVALNHRPLYVLEMACFLAPALLIWRLIIRSPGAAPVGHGRVLAVVVATSLLSTLFGLVMYGAADAHWYPVYLGRTDIWGLSARTDQQVGGLILGVVPEISDVITFLVVLASWLAAEERRA